MRQLVRTALLLVLAAVGGVPAFAQTNGQPFPQRQYWAGDYGAWQIPSQSANTFFFNPGTYCLVPAPSTGSFLPFATNAPIAIIDATAANSEVVTPSAVTNTNAQCGVTISPANNHYSFRLQSATAGLQEVLNQIAAGVAYPVEVDLDRNWYLALAGLNLASQTPAGVIGSVVGKSSAFLVDKTTAPFTYYSWNGTNYIVSASNQTAPTVAAGAGAGTGPTIAITGTGTSGTVTLTTGTTPTASATIFTLTWPAIASGGFAYAPTCSITSTGTRAYTGTNASVAGPPAIDTYTATATALTASVSGYKWAYRCY